MLEWSLGWDIYKHYFNSEITLDRLHEVFIENLRYVLDEVALLLENIDAETVAISADHGNALGESFLWDHKVGVQHPVIRQVPWVETTATDEKTLQPEEYNSREEEIAKEQLKKLGYR